MRSFLTLMCASFAPVQLCAPSLRSVKEGAAAEGLEAGKPGLGFLPARRTGALGSFAVVLVFRRRGCVLDVVENEHHSAAGFAGSLVGPGVFVKTAHHVDVGTVLELHPLDALHDAAEGLDGHVDPAVVALRTGIVDLFAEAEAREVPLLGKLHGGCIVVPSGYDGVGDDCVEHGKAPFCGVGRGEK